MRRAPDPLGLTPPPPGPAGGHAPLDLPGVVRRPSSRRRGAAVVLAVVLVLVVVGSRPGRADGFTSDRQQKDEVLQAVKQFQVAYERLDLALTRAIWPTVNARALARAFDGLRSQRVAFDRCQVTVDDDEAQALCWGTITYVPRVGGRFARTEERLWIFDLTNRNRRWLIVHAVAR